MSLETETATAPMPLHALGATKGPSYGRVVRHAVKRVGPGVIDTLDVLHVSLSHARSNALCQLLAILLVGTTDTSEACIFVSPHPHIPV